MEEPCYYWLVLLGILFLCARSSGQGKGLTKVTFGSLLCVSLIAGDWVMGCQVKAQRTSATN